LDKQERKLAKYMVSADECTSRKKAEKILGKVKETLVKIGKKLEELS